MGDVKFVATIPNTQGFWMAFPVETENGSVEILFEPIIAWQIESFREGNRHGKEFLSWATPVGLGADLPVSFAVYNKETHDWWIPETINGNGLVPLALYFAKNEWWK